MNRALSSEIYSTDYYLQICGGYEEFTSGVVAHRLKMAFGFGEVEKGMKILDIGCGRGELSGMCALLGCDVWAIDYSNDALNIASQYFMEHVKSDDLKQIKLQRMNAKSLAFPSDFFDRIFLIDIVEHLYPEELKQSLCEVNRVVKSGGKVIVHTAPIAWLIKPIYKVAGLLFGWTKHPYHVNEQSYFSLIRNLSSCEGQIKLFIEKTPGFFKLAVGQRMNPSSFKGRLARVMDTLLDHPISTALITKTPIKLILGTDLWATIDLPSQNHEMLR
jgi:2-polyprenyl-3-methyl-5-hydroxy-6-metoxy-1,4-benzoquinol methylase